MEVEQKMVKMVVVGEDLLNFEETELRLGLPGGGDNDMSKNNNNNTNANGKRGFVDTIDLKLNFFSSKENNHQLLRCSSTHPPKPPPPKAQVVGWPPVRSFRKNILAVQKSGTDERENATFVKVSLDGAPYLRKVDLKMYNSYQHLSDALGNMFGSFIIGNCGSHSHFHSEGMKDFMKERKVMDILNSCDYAPTYEDKEGDWMMLGDVPWEMFVDSCKRVRITKGAKAIGLAPRGMEKCKNRS